MRNHATRARRGMNALLRISKQIHTFSCLALGAPMAFAQAQGNPAAEPPQGPSPIEQSIQDIKNPVSWMSWGTDLRIRDECFDNLLTLDPHDQAGLHLQHYLRFRARIWTSLKPAEDVTFNVRLADEVREWLRPAGYTPYKTQSGLDWRNGIFDSLNIQWRNAFNQPLTLTVGRQDMLLGDGWLVGDGTPYDGSWTCYLDAARVTYEFKDQHTTIDAIGIVQDHLDDGWLETLNANQHLPGTEQDEKGAIFWVANKSLPAANIDTYFIYKEDQRGNAPLVNRPDNASIYTLGGRLSGMLSKHWKYSAEGACQFGRKQDGSIVDSAVLADPAIKGQYRDIRAFGLNTRLSYLFKDQLNNQLGLAYELLSGDDPHTRSDEMFDNLWGRWPRWSEIGLYSYAAETRLGNEASLHRLGPSWMISPAANLDFTASYFALFAAEDAATRGPATLFAGNPGSPASSHSDFRGHFLQAVLKYRLTKHVSTHLWSEFLFPGDYYVHHSTLFFLRSEVSFTF